MKKLNLGYILLIALLALQISCKESSTGPEPPPPDQPPVITSIEPDRAVAGDEIIITGENFSATSSENTVKFAGAVTTPSNANTTQLTVTVPDQATTGPITVEVNGLSGSSTTDFIRQYKPVVTSFSPAQAKYGEQVTITGEHFNPDISQTIVAFNLVEATVLSVSETEIVAEVPKGAGNGPVLVINKEVEHGGLSEEEFIYELTVTVSTVAGNGTAGYVDGDVSTAQFKQPYGITLDTDGNMYVADTYNSVIRKISTSGVVSTLAGTGVDGFKDGAADQAQFYGPRDLVMDGDNNLIVADTDNSRIRKILLASSEVNTLSGSGNQGHVDNSDGLLAEFDSPYGISGGADGNFYITDYYNYAIRMVTPSGSVSTLTGGISGFADGSLAEAKFGRITKLLVKEDSLYIADPNNARIRFVDMKGGVVGTLSGNGNQATIDGTLDSAEFNRPYGVTSGYWGFYISESASTANNIRLIRNGSVTTIVGNGVGFTDGDGGTAQFDRPSGMTLMKDRSTDIIYVADSYNHAIRKITVE